MTNVEKIAKLKDELTKAKSLTSKKKNQTKSGVNEELRRGINLKNTKSSNFNYG